MMATVLLFGLICVLIGFIFGVTAERIANQMTQAKKARRTYDIDFTLEYDTVI